MNIANNPLNSSVFSHLTAGLACLALACPGAATAASAPKITVTPLTEIQAAFEKVKKDFNCLRTFTISDDGKHYASAMRLGLTSWTVQVDGRPGPPFLNPIDRIAPKADFSEVFYRAVDADEKRVFVVQEANGSAKTYPLNATSSDHGDDFMVDADQSMRFRRLIRSRVKVLTPGISDPFEGREFQFDESGPVLGPFDAAHLLVDASSKHYLVAGRLLTLDTSPSPHNQTRMSQPTVFFDGVQVHKESRVRLQVSGRSA